MPRFSIVMPVHDVDTRWLEKAVNQVIAQTYGDWELCAVDDASSFQGTRAVVKGYSRRDSRIRVAILDCNMGIAMASNRALQMATGEYTAFLDDDDELHPPCLEEVAELMLRDPGVGIIYTDQDKVDLPGNQSGAVIKPDWSPDLFSTYKDLCHLVVCRRSLVERNGGFRGRGSR